MTLEVTGILRGVGGSRVGPLLPKSELNHAVNHDQREHVSARRPCRRHGER
jgi:hypothetical protein